MSWRYNYSIYDSKGLRTASAYGTCETPTKAMSRLEKDFQESERDRPKALGVQVMVVDLHIVKTLGY